MEDRCQQFHTDAQKPWDATKSAKETRRLRKFLYKNQSHRFTDREQSHLFQAIQCHVTAYGGSSGKDTDEDHNPALALVEDALKMPFTVFTTSQKKTMLKWLEKLKPDLAQKGASAGKPAAAGSTWSVMAVTQTAASLMSDEGDECDVLLAVCDISLVDQLRQQFDAGAAVVVTLDPSQKHIIKVDASS